MKKKRTRSVLLIVLAVILLIVLIMSLTINIVFSRNDTPKVFGYYVYMMETDTMDATAHVASASADATVDVATYTTEEESENAAASIHQNTAVFAKALSDTDLPAKNNAILCTLGETDTSTDIDSDGIAVRRILSVEQDSSGILYYYPTTMVPEMVGTEPAITRDNILGLCSFESSEIYSFVNFTRSVTGILVLLALPAIILVIMLIVAIVRASSHRGDEYAFEEDYDEVYNEDSYDDINFEESLGTSPIYRPNNQNSTGFDQKRDSIAENFERKPVNPNSPYQKARTMQFKAQSDQPIYGDPNQQIPLDGSREYYGTHGGAVTDTGSFGTHQTRGYGEPSSRQGGNTYGAGDTGASQYHGSHEAQAGEEPRGLSGSRFASSSNNNNASSRPTTSHAANSGTSRSTSSRNKYEDASVDELIAMIENEKRKTDKKD